METNSRSWNYVHPTLLLAVIVGCVFIVCTLWAFSVLVGCGQPLAPASQNAKQATQSKTEGTDRPFLAIWHMHDGFPVIPPRSEAPYLRMAIWEEGRVLFGKDPTKWSHDLRQGRINGDRVAQLKQAVIETGVFDLPGYCYLMPDASCDCMMLDFGDRQQMLYGVEDAKPGWGMGPHFRKFAECWKEVNELALAARPEKSDKVNERFRKPPDSWILKKAIQSK